MHFLRGGGGGGGGGGEGGEEGGGGGGYSPALDLQKPVLFIFCPPTFK